MQLNTTNEIRTKGVTVMLPAAAAAGRNDTAVNYIAQELVFGGKIKIRLTQDKK